jgi:alpha-L-rhamnosidase
MNSFNHYAYGAIGAWLYAHVAGIQAAEPGYKKIRIAPQPGGGLTWAKATLNTLYGKISSDWKLEGDALSLTVTVPPNTTCEVVLPGGAVHHVGPGTYSF